MRDKTIFGFRMEKQSARRRLVIAVYAVLALLIAGGWLLDQLRTSGVYIFFTAYLINWGIFGGYGASGLIKPFSGKAPRQQSVPTSLVELELYRYGNLRSANDADYRNDEREVLRRDRVHYQAYQWMVGLLAWIWLLATWQHAPLSFMSARVLSMALYLFTIPVIVLAITLPQAILLWTEPDMEREEESSSRETVSHS